MLWAGASSSVSFFIIWSASRGDHIDVTGCSTLGGGTTLGGVAVGDIVGVGSDAPLGYCKGRWGVGTMPVISNSDPNFCVSVNCTLLVCLGGAIGGSVVDYLSVSIPA